MQQEVWGPTGLGGILSGTTEMLVMEVRPCLPAMFGFDPIRLASKVLVVAEVQLFLESEEALVSQYRYCSLVLVRYSW